MSSKQTRASDIDELREAAVRIVVPLAFFAVCLAVIYLIEKL
ncbi:MAG TPA: hypothetical protein VG889_01760 [Rhizomicrobium sp.]|nr:hypothetical protein [Rhizomicrobium sp.]